VAGDSSEENLASMCSCDDGLHPLLIQAFDSALLTRSLTETLSIRSAF